MSQSMVHQVNGQDPSPKSEGSSVRHSSQQHTEFDSWLKGRQVLRGSGVKVFTGSTSKGSRAKVLVLAGPRMPTGGSGVKVFTGSTGAQGGQVSRRSQGQQVRVQGPRIKGAHRVKGQGVLRIRGQEAKVPGGSRVKGCLRIRGQLSSQDAATYTSGPNPRSKDLATSALCKSKVAYPPNQCTGCTSPHTFST
eukprot:1161426-Pelagomonas_calceolata.AAC.3